MIAPPPIAGDARQTITTQSDQSADRAPTTRSSRTNPSGSVNDGGTSTAGHVSTIAHSGAGSGTPPRSSRSANTQPTRSSAVIGTPDSARLVIRSATTAAKNRCSAEPGAGRSLAPRLAAILTTSPMHPPRTAGRAGPGAPRREAGPPAERGFPSARRFAFRLPLRPASARPAAVAMPQLLTKTTKPETIRAVDATNRLRVAAHQRLSMNAEKEPASSA